MEPPELVASNVAAAGSAPGTVRRVLALIVDFQTTEDTRRLSLQLAQAPRETIDLTVVHVDNGNPAPVALSDAQWRHGIRLLRVSHNGGYGSGIRDAIRQLEQAGEQFDAYWFLNSDLEVSPDCLSRIVEVLRRDPDVGAVGPTIFKGRSRDVWGARGVVSPLLGTTAMRPWPGGELPLWSYLPGCSLLVRAAAYADVGGLPDRYGMYYEEAEMCVRLQKSGWKLWVEARAEAYHGVASMHAGIPARHYAFYFARNNLYFWQANFGIPWMLQLPRTLFVVLKDLVLPLRRARTAAEAFDRIRFIAMGLADSVAFLRQRFTPYERRHFSLEPPTAS
jgi:GT2 family glycosyltransferase